jgi:UDP-N-acetylmuramoylalanine--D-glutamate ligase
VAVKHRLFAHQAPGDWAVLNRDDPASAALGPTLPGRVAWFGRAGGGGGDGAWLEGTRVMVAIGGGRPAAVADLAECALEGRHNQSNVLAAALAATLAGAAPDAVRAGLAGFRPLRHRMQLVWRAADVAYYDDLNSTSPDAARAALANFRETGRRVVWIAGGEDKGLAFDALAQEAAPTVRAVLLLPGAGSERLAAALGGLGGAAPPVARCDSLAAAVDAAVAAAKPGDAVLLSPACPGVFSRHYLEDGVEGGGFRHLVRARAGGAAKAVEEQESV